MAKVTEIFQNAKKAENAAQLCREKLTLLVCEFDPRCCNFCRNIFAVKDLKLCAACATAKYCSKDCQVKHWLPKHSQQCLEIRNLRERVFNYEEENIIFQQGSDKVTKLNEDTNVRVKSTGAIKVSPEQWEEFDPEPYFHWD